MGAAASALHDAYPGFTTVTADPASLVPALREKLAAECRGLIDGRYTSGEFITDIEDAME
jgi:hypothetical protein